MTEVTRTTPRITKERIAAGKALLVCAYASDDKFAQYHLEGAMSLTDFQNGVGILPKDQEIIFYCN